MNGAATAGVWACFENAMEILPIVVPESGRASAQGPLRGSLPQMPQMPQPQAPARRVFCEAGEEVVAGDFGILRDAMRRNFYVLRRRHLHRRVVLLKPPPKPDFHPIFKMPQCGPSLQTFAAPAKSRDA